MFSTGTTFLELLYALFTVGFTRSFSDKGYSVYNVPHDGQCAFASICHQLCTKGLVQDAITADDVRRDLVNYLSANDELKQVISERLVGQTIEQYISDMRHRATWADENMLHVASIFYDVNIHVIRTDLSPPTEIGSSSGERSIVIGYVSLVAGESPTHYVSLLPCTGYLHFQIWYICCITFTCHQLTALYLHIS